MRYQSHSDDVLSKVANSRVKGGNVATSFLLLPIFSDVDLWN